MAFFTDTHNERGAAVSFFGGIVAFFERIVDAQNRSGQVHRLQDLSDRELADIGITREHIVRHVFRDVYHV